MPAGSARLGPARIAWSVPDAHPEASGGLAFLADAAAPVGVSWRVVEGEPDALPGAHDAFLGDVRIRVAPGCVRIVGPEASFVVSPTSVEGRVRDRSSLAATTALHALAAFHGLVHVHAAVITLDGRTWLAPGGSGAGKTSLALGIARAGGELGTDDVAYVDPEGVVWPLRRPPHVLADTQARYAELSVLGPVQDGALDKKRIESPSAGPARPSPVDAVLFPCIEPTSTTHLDPIEPSQAFALLVGSSAFAMIEGSPERDRQLDTLARLAERPIACLVAGRDALEQPRVLADVVRGWRVSG